MSDQQTITRSSLLISVFTFSSRILGMVRDMLRAEFFGVSPVAKAFIIAFKIPNTLRNLVAEGALTQAFIPVFTEYLYGNKDNPEDKEKAFAMANAVITLLLIILIGIVMLGELLAPFIVRLFSWQWQIDETLLLTLQLTRIMFPYILFVSLASLFMGILNTFRHFTAPAMSPVVLNITIILFYLIVLPRYSNAVSQIKALAIGVVIGGFFQFFVQIVTAHRNGYRFSLSIKLNHPAIRKIFTIMLPAAFGSGIYQINQIIDLIFAASIENRVPGAVASLEYAVRLMQMPLGVFGIAISTAILPLLARLAVENKNAAFMQELRSGISFTAFLTFPAMAGLTLLAQPIIELIFERGAFDSYSTSITIMPLVFYSVGIFSYSSVKISVSAFYSLKDSRTPVTIAAIILTLTVAMNFIFIQFMDHAALALSATLGSFLHLSILLWTLRKKIGEPLQIISIILPIVKTGLSTIAMIITIIVMLSLDGKIESFFGKGYVALIIIISMLVYFFTAWLLKNRHFFEITSILKRKS